MKYIIIFSVISYLIGSINLALIISKKLYGTDLRTQGSGNAGATNALRVHGKKVGAAVLAFDFFKAFSIVLIAKCFVSFGNAPYVSVLFSGFFVQLGHSFPVFFGFKGGKGVASAAGAATALFPLAALILISIFAVIVLISKKVSLGSLITASVYPLIVSLFSSENRYFNFIFAASCAALIIIRHLPNIVRILDGNEKNII